MVNGDGLHELLGAEAAPALEELLAVRRAEPEMLRQALERGLLDPCLGQEGDRPADQVVVTRPVGAQRGYGVLGCWAFSMVILAVVSGGDPRLVGLAAIRPVSCGRFRNERTPALVGPTSWRQEQLHL